MPGMNDESDSQRAPVGDRFGYLLKHARERLVSFSEPALAPLGITGRDVAVLTVLADGAPPSQLEAAQRLAIDRTSMVAAIDRLEDLGLVQRRADTADRRRNIVVLTDLGAETLRQATRATDDAEALFLEPLAPAERKRFREMLQQLVDRRDA
jgi:DNA-binding MarR family transcriptional regulator